MAEVAGIELADLRDPLYWALLVYQGMGEDRLTLDRAAASQLTPTPDKPNSARSATPVLYDGEKVGDLYVIAFKPGDGTGDEKTFSLGALQVAAGLPRKPKVVPRAKAAHSEAMLTLLTHPIDIDGIHPTLFAGRFELLSLDGDLVRPFGRLGWLGAAGERPMPTSTFTVGYDTEGKRFGDPHAIFSSLPDAVQVCAFFAVDEAVIKAYPGIFESLLTKRPQLA